jgi:hypothetical protein
MLRIFFSPQWSASAWWELEQIEMLVATRVQTLSGTVGKKMGLTITSLPRANTDRTYSVEV